MSEGLAEVRLLSLGYMSTVSVCLSRGPYISEISWAQFQIDAVFINKPQILFTVSIFSDWGGGRSGRNHISASLHLEFLGNICMC